MVSISIFKINKVGNKKNQESLYGKVLYFSVSVYYKFFNDNVQSIRFMPLQNVDIEFVIKS